MIRSTLLAAALALAPLFAWAADEPTVERLFVLDCGQSTAKDQARWSPGVNAGQPIVLSDNCYAIKHARGWMLWDTGYPDALAALPEGQTAADGASVAKRRKTLAAQLKEIGIAPSDVDTVAVSHTHGDHVGNLDLFPNATLIFQEAEYQFAFADKPKPFPATQTVRLLKGDLDVFGDGSVTILSTPGHTPGHQSLMVRLAKTGVVLLSGDAVHFKSNWDNRRVPGMNADKDKTLASMQRLADLMAQHKAQLWINHDKPQSDAQIRAPKFYE
jgi:glyoxylase-like metal-dependent hydrolase (beta-lactamase superfamily II)